MAGRESRCALKRALYGRTAPGTLAQRKLLSRREICLGDAVMPAQMFFVPERPKKSEKARSSGNQVSKASPNHLPRRRNATMKAHEPHTSQHHAWRGAAKNRKQREILGVKQRERGARHHEIEPVEADMAAQDGEQREHAPEAEYQERAVNQRGTPALSERCNREERRVPHIQARVRIRRTR